MPGCWVCDSHNHDRLVPLGAIGELLIEGNLAREYLGDRALTDRAFIRNPKWAKSTGDIQSSRRFYKTGDLVYQDFDGSFVFVARKDTQVKVSCLSPVFEKLSGLTREIVTWPKD